jgi:hypothetical protein
MQGDSSLKNYEIIQNCKFKNSINQIQTIDKDKFVPKGTRIQIHPAPLNDSTNGNINGTVKDSRNTGIEIDKEFESKDTVQLQVDTDELLIDESVDTKLIIDEARTTYDPYSLNYYWPLDEEHDLNVLAFKKQIAIRKKNSDIWNTRKNNCKIIHSTNKKINESTTRYSEQNSNNWKKSHLDKINVVSLLSSQSKQEYSAKVKSKQIYPPIMSNQLIKRVPKAPVFPPY